MENKATTNLSRRFPTATLEEIQSALEAEKGHAARACRILRTSHQEGRAVEASNEETIEATHCKTIPNC